MSSPNLPVTTATPPPPQPSFPPPPANTPPLQLTIHLANVSQNPITPTSSSFSSQSKSKSPSPPPPDSPPPPSNSSHSSPPPPPSDLPDSPPPPPNDPPPPPTKKSPESPPPPKYPPKSPPPPPEETPPPPPEETPPPPEETPPPPPEETPPPPPEETPPPPEDTPPPPPKEPPPPPTESKTPQLPPPPKSSPTPPAGTRASTPPSPSVLSPPPPHVPTINGSGGNHTAQSPQSSQGGPASGTLVTIILVLGVLFIGIFGFVGCCVWRRKKKASVYNCGYVLPPSLVSNSSPESNSSALLKNLTTPDLSPNDVNNGSAKGLMFSPRTPGALGKTKTWFTYEELHESTNAFSVKNLLGEGGFGSVYKGNLPDGREVAVKQLKIGGGQGKREFRSEVEIISRIHHRHLVSLVGYCIYENRRLLVYEYVPNNSLYFHLHNEGKFVMDWATRVRIAIGAARGIAYLHEDCHPRIIHRDIKSSNILLDSNFEARVSDFGLAKLAIDASIHSTNSVMGTFGYMAPEFASTGKLTEKSDVYSYGVVLLELITGHKPVDTFQPLGEESLVEWARPLLSHAIETHEFLGLADPKLESRYEDDEMFRMIEAAAACVRHSCTRRPKMGQVARALDSIDMGDLSNGMRVGESGMFNSARESEEIRMFKRMAFGCQDYSTGFFIQDCWSSEGDQINSHSRQINQ